MVGMPLRCYHGIVWRLFHLWLLACPHVSVVSCVEELNLWPEILRIGYISLYLPR